MPPLQAQPSIDGVRVLRQSLWSAGYPPVPVYGLSFHGEGRGKRPFGEAWQHAARGNPPRATREAPRLDALNTGVLCDGLRVIDIDIEDRSIADAIETEARGLLGLAPCRYRENSGKRALFYRAAEGEPKKASITGMLGKVEVLGHGQQIVADGFHPSGVALKWRDADGVVIDGLDKVPRATLPVVSEGDIAAFLDLVREMIGAKLEALPVAAPAPAASAPSITGDLDARRMKSAASRALQDEVAKLAGMAKDSGRNDALNAIAFRLGRFIAGGALERDSAELALSDACSRNGLWSEGANACRATIKSGLEKGIAAGAPSLSERDRPASAPVLDPSPLLTGREAGAGRDESRLPLFWHGEGAAIPARRELVKGLLPAGEVAIIAGQSGAGKTFIALDLAASLALQSDFFGHRVREAGGTLFILGEGGGTISERLEAVRIGRLQGDESAQEMPIAWHALTGSLSHDETLKAVLALANKTGREMQARHGVPLRLIVVDTLAAAFAMQDENDAAAATLAMKVLQRFHVETGALVAAVAHYGKTAETGIRGSSAFTASADAILAVHADRDPMTGKVSARSLALTKSRWRDTGWQSAFDLQSVLIGHDDDGDDVWSCWVKPGGEVIEKAARGSRQSKGVSFLLQALTFALGEAGERKFPFGTDGPEVLAVTREALRSAFYTRYPADGETEAKRTQAKNKAFNRALLDGQSAGVIGFKDEGREAWVWKL